MTKLAIRLGSVLMAAWSTVAHAQSAGGTASPPTIASVLGNLPIDKLTEQVGKAVAYIVEQWSAHKNTVKSDSVGRLVIDLGELSGLENALALLIDPIVQRPDLAYNGAAIRPDRTEAAILAKSKNVLRMCSVRLTCSGAME